MTATCPARTPLYGTSGPMVRCELPRRTHLAALPGMRQRPRRRLLHRVRRHRRLVGRPPAVPGPARSRGLHPPQRAHRAALGPDPGRAPVMARGGGLVTSGSTPPERWVTREHGTRSGYVAGCRCEPCRTANRGYVRHYWRTYVRELEHVPDVPADRARAHILALREGGMGKRLIAAAAGLSEQNIDRISAGRTKRGIRPETERAILAVKHRPFVTPSTGSTRRVRALAAMGYTARMIAEHAGISHAQVAAHMVGSNPSIRTADHDRLVAAFDALAMRPGPSAYARTSARTKGWAPPLAWDDDTIDNPAAEPAGSYRPAPLGIDVDEVDLLVSHGEHPDNIATRLDRTRESIRQACHRTGRDDLAAHFARRAA